jgi:hypothetical protein
VHGLVVGSSWCAAVGMATELSNLVTAPRSITHSAEAVHACAWVDKCRGIAGAQRVDVFLWLFPLPRKTSNLWCVGWMAAEAPPGYFFGSDGVYPCPAGSFKEGFTAQGVRCTTCEAAGRTGFTTAAAAATSERDCSGEVDGPMHNVTPQRAHLTASYAFLRLYCKHVHQ